MDLKGLLGESYKEGMTVDEINTALAGIELPKDQTAEINKLRTTISDKNSEAAEWRRKYEATLSEEEKKKAAVAQEHQDLLDKIATLEKAQTIATNKNAYLAMGWPEELAGKAAQALADGDITKLFELQKQHQDALSEQIKKDLLKNTGRPGGSGNETPLEDDDSVKLARELGKNRAESDKAASDAMKQFLK